MPSLIKLAERESLTTAQEGAVDALLRDTTIERLNNPEQGYPVLIYATMSGNIDLMRKLLEFGVDKNIEVDVAKQGRTPKLKNALEIAGSTIYKREPPGGGRSVVDDGVKIGVILELGGAEDDSWRQYTGQRFRETFNDATSEGVAMPPAEMPWDGDGRDHKYKKHKRKSHKRKSHKRKSHKRKSHKRKSHKRKSHKRKASRRRR